MTLLQSTKTGQYSVCLIILNRFRKIRGGTARRLDVAGIIRTRTIAKPNSSYAFSIESMIVVSAMYPDDAEGNARLCNRRHLPPYSMCTCERLIDDRPNPTKNTRVRYLPKIATPGVITPGVAIIKSIKSYLPNNWSLVTDVPFSLFTRTK